MDDSSVLDRLANHANVLDDPAIPAEKSIVFNLWQANRSGHRPPIEELCRDVLNCLENANTLVNGSSPSSRTVKRSEIDPSLVYTISTIIDCCQEYSLLWEKRSKFDEKTRMLLRESIWQITHGWCALLAGDIDSIIEYVIVQGKLKGLVEAQ